MTHKRSKIEWIQILNKATAGHRPAAVDVYNSSFADAIDLEHHGLLQQSTRLLDLGCGNGRLAIALTESTLLQSYNGVDPVIESIEFCKWAFAPYERVFNFQWIDVFNEYYTPNGGDDPAQFKLPFAPEQFDTVVASSLFTHLGSAEVCRNYLTEIHRVLANDGKLFCSWFRSPPNEPSSRVLRTVLSEAAIITMVTELFEVFHSRGGFTKDFNDQWCLYARKK